MAKVGWAVVVLFVLSTLVGCGGSAPQQSTTGRTGQGAAAPAGRVRLIAFVGSASKPPAEEAKATYEKRNPGVTVDMTFAGSGTLLQQMILEQTGDIYWPGSDDFMDKAEAKGAVIPETRRIIAYLVPAICVREGNPKGIRELADLARPGITVGLAEAGAVCLGDVSAMVLEDVGLLAEVKRNVITYAKSCEQTQQLVQLGEVDAVIGWDVFEKWTPERVDSIPIPVKLARVRNIPAAVSVYSKQREAAQEFVDCLASSEGKAIFAKHGYSIEPPGQ